MVAVVLRVLHALDRVPANTIMVGPVAVSSDCRMREQNAYAQRLRDWFLKPAGLTALAFHLELPAIP